MTTGEYEEAANGCWEWQRAMSGNGYGMLTVDGRVRLAHRVIYERIVGPIPEGHHLRRKCGNRACVNPDHLEPIAAAEHNRLSGGAHRSIRYEVDTISGCWNFLGAMGAGGYGVVRRDGKHRRAHRVVYSEQLGPIPDGHVLHHTCGNKRCVNPAHLEPLTPGQHKQRHRELAKAA